MLFLYCNTKGYIKSNAFAKNVTLNGNTIDTKDPIGDFKIIKNATTESKNKIQ